MKLFYLLTFGVSFLLFCSCSPTKTLVDTSCPGYKKMNFDRQSLHEKGIGVMPVLGGGEKEQFRRPMGNAITKYLRSEFGDDKVKSTNQVITILNNEGLTESYNQALEGYTTSGIVPKKMVNRLGEALDVQYLLYTRLLTDSEISTVYTGSSSQIINVDELYVQTQVWDTEIGDVVWEGKGGTAKLDEDKSDVVEKTAHGLSKVIGNPKNQGPCEDKSDLIESKQKASTNTYLAILGVSTGVSLLILLAL